ncbi:Protein TOC75 [Monoraphidium neglectum]|uniref:Protein TOC75 n=1 Tax=Monoraphidium neglectum TaxID=145388 RepID=A0A0D2LT73_9CHLO|nr:Protein TOC75 [Monoraphidium neglectum]KIY94844.1 Protein TOC75 [Monoraphidium neglectum]|eukprot:XP_013893864.1 Protein TOC75 [Monoraphidium neglectum]
MDNVQFVNGNQLGRRLLLQVDQGLNLKLPLPGGRALGFGGGLYNRVTAAFTKFVQLPGLGPLTDDDVWLRRKAPNTLVLHARAGNCIGDMASRKLPGTVYAFAEYGTDLGSGRSLQGSPTEYYRKAGRGASYGVGLKALGACRFEYARDCNAGTGNWFVHWGERF